ncbi:MAG: Fe-S cluster assembly protein SufD [Bacteroidales bacterium]|nr:Fe-S cluster assembly protein SufD [Bacteroidales bacterium]
MDREEINSYFSKYFERYDAEVPAADFPEGGRNAAREMFLKEGMPDRSQEAWRRFPWERVVGKPYRMCLQPEPYRPMESYFQCSTQAINSEMFPFLNGWYLHCNAPLTRFPNGLVVGSLREALRICPEMVRPYLHRLSADANGWVSFNQALWQDGFFVYVPDHVRVHHPIQLVNMVKAEGDIMVQPHHLVVLGEEASLKLVHCDESLECGDSLINTVTEIQVGAHARFDYYKLENKDNRSTMVNHLFIRQEEGSTANTHTNVFNGGLVCNTIRVDLAGAHASVNNNGLYLVDGTQHVTNVVSVRHHATDCVSNQLYKGILDGEAQAGFMGHVLVDPHAQRTEAHQINRNMLLKDTARISTKPFLEIYADDVQCTHGATVGQMDEEAVFYLRSRGICEQNARILLMHAFTKEVIDRMDIPALCERTESLVSKRLSGESINCGSCMQCSRKFDFQVKMPEY